MGIKLEYVLTIAIVGIIAGSLMLKLRDTPAPIKVSTKEVEFTDTTLIEVDTDDIKSRVYATYGVRDKGVLTLDDIVYLSDKVESLSSNKAKFNGDLLYLDGNVILREKDGYTYKTEHAVYDKKTEILHITSPFIGVKGKNTIEGESMEYDIRKKKATGTTVGTVFYTPDK